MIVALAIVAVFVFAACSPAAPAASSAPAESAAAPSEAASEAPAESAAAPAESAAAPAESAAAPAADNAAAPEGDWTDKMYGVSVMAHSNPFFLKESDTIKAIAEADGSEFTSPDPANDISTQVQQISEMIARGIDVLIVDPIDSEGIEPALVEAERAGIPVINIDSVVTNKDLVQSIIVSDNVDAGRQAGRTLCESIGGEGKIAIVNWSALGAVRDRTDGLKQVIEEEFPNVEIVADQDANGIVEDAQSITDTFLQANPDLKGIFAINDPTAQGVAAALQGANKTKDVVVVSVDGSQNGIDMIKEGQLMSSPVQQPALIAETATKVAKQVWSGQTPEKEIIIPVINITPDNWKEYDGKTY